MFFFYRFCILGTLPVYFCCFFFNDTATTEIYTLSLHDALPIPRDRTSSSPLPEWRMPRCREAPRDRKSTRLNSSHVSISYAVFCLKNKNYRLKGPIRKWIDPRDLIFCTVF